ncbi:hypothetical protein HMSSN036_59560 [Paenibacillus macerans]|nr:hypothetical protein HMSSN036_59560 [Paenibacillus macerans]
MDLVRRRIKEPKKAAAAEAVLTAERKEELLRTISLKEEEVNQITGEQQAKVYEEIGLAFHELGEEDQAMDAFEKKSLQAKKIGWRRL